MPSITVQLGKTEPEMKRELIEKITKAAADVTFIPSEAFTVYIDEYDLTSIGVGGQSLAEKHK